MCTQPRGMSRVRQELEPRLVSLFTVFLIISALQSHGHTFLREGWKRERSGAAWHPTRKRCGAEAASDNASC